jgi:hypothetical protein
VEPTNWKGNGKRAAGHGNLPGKIIRSSYTRRLYSEFVLPLTTYGGKWKESGQFWYIYIYMYIRSLDTRRFYSTSVFPTHKP